jgi:hypothetical protein
MISNIFRREFYHHSKFVLQTNQYLPMIHVVFGNLDAWLLGTHHGFGTKHLQGYLNEFVFRFNRRFLTEVKHIGSPKKYLTY